MKKIDLEPDGYRETGRARLVRSILHKPVFMTISTVLGVWVAVSIGVVQQSNGFGRSPEWAFWTLYPSFVLMPAFFLFAALADDDRTTSVAEQGTSVLRAPRPGSPDQRSGAQALPKSEDYRDEP